MSDVESPVSTTITQKLGAEGLGTFVLVFAGAGTAALSGYGLVATGLAFAFAYVLMGYAVGHLSGAHFNPAVSVGAGVSGRMAWREVGLYAAAQVAGALVAGLALFAIFHGFEEFDAEGNMGQNFFGEEAPREFALWAALIVELLGTFLFVTLFHSATDRRNPNVVMAPVVIGLTLALIHFVTLGMTGTSINPARSIGVGLFAGGDAVVQLWLFILAPLLGAVAAGFAYPAIFGRDAEPVPGSGLDLSLPKRPAAAATAGTAVDTEQQWVAPAEEQAAEQQQWQTEYPGWKWDAEAQEWVADPTTAPEPEPELPQWDRPADEGEAATQQFPIQDRDQP